MDNKYLFVSKIFLCVVNRGCRVLFTNLLCMVEEEIGSSCWSATRIWDSWKFFAITVFLINIMNTTQLHHETLLTIILVTDQLNAQILVL
jgi:hypothetical protein